jgi:hypothetical protein
MESDKKSGSFQWEHRMPIMIDKVTLSSKAPVGTVVGTLTLIDEAKTARKAYYMLDEDSVGLFVISGSNLVTLKTPIPPGLYCVNMRARAQYIRCTNKASFIIVVT